MTIEEFNSTKWRQGMMATYGEYDYSVVACDFSERLVQLDDGQGDSFWVRCENVELKNA
jgi:hypothetical protein